MEERASSSWSWSTLSAAGLDEIPLLLPLPSARDNSTPLVSLL